MSLSPILAVTQITQSQAGKDITINDHLKAIEKEFGYLSKSVAGSGTVNLTADEARYGVIEITGALTGHRTINVPSGFTHSFVIFNNTTGAGWNVDVTFNGGTAIRIPRGCAVPVRNNAGAGAYDYRAGMVKLPEAIAYRNTSTQTLTNNAETVLQWNAESWDNSTSMDVASTWRFTVPATGLYLVRAVAQITLSGVVTGTYNGHIAIRSGGTVIRRGDQQAFGIATGNMARHTVEAMVQCTQGALLDAVFSNGITGGTIVLDYGSDKSYFEVMCLRLGS